jgi:CRP/FNR family transcriptional regulator
VGSAAEFAEYGHYASFSAGTAISSSRDAEPSYGLVLSGVVKSCLVTPTNRTYVTGLQFEGQLVQPPASADSQFSFLEAATAVSLFGFSQQNLDRMLAEQDSARRLLPRLMAAELACSRSWVSLLGRRTVEEKLAGFLRLLAEHTGDQCETSGATIVEIPLSRGQTADFLGITPESISRGVTALRRTGVIRLRDMRNFEILKPERLAQLAGE